MITYEEAELQAKALEAAAAASPIRQLRYDLDRRAKEWSRAARELHGTDDDEAVIEFAGAVVPGMRVPFVQTDGETGWGTVIRTMTRDGQLTVHFEDYDGRPIYRNLFGAASPIVVMS